MGYRRLPLQELPEVAAHRPRIVEPRGVAGTLHQAWFPAGNAPTARVKMTTLPTARDWIERGRPQPDSGMRSIAVMCS
jgi:hypothetical protein